MAFSRPSSSASVGVPVRRRREVDKQVGAVADREVVEAEAVAARRRLDDRRGPAPEVEVVGAVERAARHDGRLRTGSARPSGSGTESRSERRTRTLTRPGSRSERPAVGRRRGASDRHRVCASTSDVRRKIGDARYHAERQPEGQGDGRDEGAGPARMPPRRREPAAAGTASPAIATPATTEPIDDGDAPVVEGSEEGRPKSPMDVHRGEGWRGPRDGRDDGRGAGQADVGAATVGGATENSPPRRSEERLDLARPPRLVPAEVAPPRISATRGATAAPRSGSSWARAGSAATATSSIDSASSCRAAHGDLRLEERPAGDERPEQVELARRGRRHPAPRSRGGRPGAAAARVRPPRRPGPLPSSAAIRVQPGPVGRADEPAGRRSGSAVPSRAAGAEDRVDDVAGHDPVGRVLAAADADDPVRLDVTRGARATP